MPAAGRLAVVLGRPAAEVVRRAGRTDGPVTGTAWTKSLCTPTGGAGDVADSRPRCAATGRGDLAGALVQRAVDLAEELVLHDDEDRHRGGDDGDADRRGGDQREPGAKAHSSRSA